MPRCLSSSPGGLGLGLSKIGQSLAITGGCQLPLQLFVVPRVSPVIAREMKEPAELCFKPKSVLSCREIQYCSVCIGVSVIPVSLHANNYCTLYKEPSLLMYVS